ncbi:MAG: ABC-F family ATP-binding cassette domain-containing protein [Lachnospiraceae bacterium]|nr:ABC-F family ATP-binding cassette domain-containing protein [Lachnospiraceae bacterium]
MLQVKNLTITHKKDLRVLIKEFSCTFNYGDKAVIIGEEGDGKSTLLRWIYDGGMIEEYAQSEGEIILGNEKLSYLPQELGQEYKELSVYEFFSMEPMFWEQTPKELALMARKMNVTTEFFYSEQQMNTLSGGEKVKAQMMRILMGKPTVLLLDEPSNDIDIATLEWLEKEILDWPYIVVFISHDETLIENTANMVIHIEQLKRKQECKYTVCKTTYERYKEERGLKLANQRQQALNDQREKKIREEKFRKIQQKVENAQANVSRQNPHIGQLLKKKMHAVKAMEHRFEREDVNMTQMPEEESAIFFKLGGEEAKLPAGKVILDYSLEKLFTPDGQSVLARDIRLFVRGPERICIIGENGAGKTTLLKKLATELLKRSDILAEYMPQNYEEFLDMEKSPVDFLDKSGDKEERTRIRTYLGSLKYTADEMEHSIRELSGGQKAKVLLLKMSLSGANVLILDEPTRNFSPLSGPVLREMLASFPGCIISISHDRKYIEEVCTQVYKLSEEGLLLL